ncbi:MAG: hypothetical protein NTV22_13210 [bacterium]|nr:hypothetical protein [bacterium]
MLAAVKGVCEKGVIKPLEPIGLKGRVDVIMQQQFYRHWDRYAAY